MLARRNGKHSCFPSSEDTEDEFVIYDTSYVHSIPLNIQQSDASSLAVPTYTDDHSILTSDFPSLSLQNSRVKRENLGESGPLLFLPLSLEQEHNRGLSAQEKSNIMKSAHIASAPTPLHHRRVFVRTAGGGEFHAPVSCHYFLCHFPPPLPSTNHFPGKCIFYLDTSFLFISLRLVAVITSLGHARIKRLERKKATSPSALSCHSHPNGIGLGGGKEQEAGGAGPKGMYLSFNNYGGNHFPLPWAC